MWKVLNSFSTSSRLLPAVKIVQCNAQYVCLAQRLTRRISTSFQAFAKGFLERENQFAHHVMELNPSYTCTLLSINKSAMGDVEKSEFDKILTTHWTTATPSNVCQAFKTISHISCITAQPITGQELDELVKSLVQNMALYTDEELSIILQSLSFWPPTESLNSHNFVNIWSALDKECVARAKEWNTEKLLYFADHFYALHLLKVTKFMKILMRKMTGKPKRLTPSQLVQFMFYANVCRIFKPSTSAYDIEYQLEKCIDSLSLDEIAILAMGFFKTQTRINMPELFTKMIQRAISEVDQVNEITLAALVKTFRFSLPVTHADMLYRLLDKLVPNIPRLSLICCLHIALAGTNTQVYHEEVLGIIAQKFVDEIQKLRLKDMERITFALTLFNVDPKTTPCIYQEIVRELGREERREELEKYPKCLPSSLHFLTLRKIFPQELIGRALSQEFITNTYGSYHGKIGREIICLDTTVAIECPDYTQPRLTEELRHHLGKNHTHAVPQPQNAKRMSVAERMFVEVVKSLEEMLEDSRYLYAGNIIPNSQKPDIVCALTANLTPREIPEIFRTVKLGDIKRPVHIGDDITWYCIVIGGWNSYIRGTEQPLGSLAMKLRQLHTLGYRTVLIPWYKWLKVGAPERRLYLKQCFSESDGIS